MSAKNPRGTVREMPDEELVRLVAEGVPDLTGLARGEYTERRALRLLRRMPWVAFARRATEWEDHYEKTDLVVRRCDGAEVRVQVKSAPRVGIAQFKTGRASAKAAGVVFVSLPVAMTDREVYVRLWRTVGSVNDLLYAGHACANARHRTQAHTRCPAHGDRSPTLAAKSSCVLSQHEIINPHVRVDPLQPLPSDRQRTQA